MSFSISVLMANPLITGVVETGGKNEATDTITAKWTGVTFVNGVANEPLSGSAVDDPYTVGFFGNQVPAYVDRNHQWADADPGVPIPSYLIGGEYIMCGNDNRENTDYRLDITVSEPVYVYMLIDDRLTDGDNMNPPESGADVSSWSAMTWLGAAGFQPVMTGQNRFSDANVPDHVGIDEGADSDIDQWSSIYSKAENAGTFSIFQADNAGRNMYGVVITAIPEPTTTALLLFGLGGLFLARRRK